MIGFSLTATWRIAARAIVPAIVLLGFDAATGRAQQPAPQSDHTAPVALTAAPPNYPAVQTDGTAVFRLMMPNAHSVELHLEGTKDPIPMQKDVRGEWSANVPGLPPEYYSYSYAVDGADVLDPHNTHIKTSFFSNQNVFLLPGKVPLPWEAADVPHGTVHHHHYHSQVVGADSEYYVYTPPGFDPRVAHEYPVLYLLHGYSDDASAWTWMGKADVILDNLISAGKAKPMIVVMPLGYGDMRVITEGWASWREPALVRSNFGNFEKALYQEVMPLVKQQYPLSDRREDHAIAGLSMGGAETLLVGLNHTEDFAWIGAFSAGGLGGDHFEPNFPAITAHSGPGIESRLKLLWIACGTEDGLFAPNQKFIAWLQQQGIQPTAIQTPGMHAWMVWRNNLSSFLPLLFQPK